MSLTAGTYCPRCGVTWVGTGHLCQPSAATTSTAVTDADKWREEAMYRGQRIEHLEAVLARVEALVNNGQTVGWVEADGGEAWVSVAAVRAAVRGDL